jgi:hypothetical protein
MFMHFTTFIIYLYEKLLMGNFLCMCKYRTARMGITLGQGYPRNGNMPDGIGSRGDRGSW